MEQFLAGSLDLDTYQETLGRKLTRSDLVHICGKVRDEMQKKLDSVKRWGSEWSPMQMM